MVSWIGSWVGRRRRVRGSGGAEGWIPVKSERGGEASSDVERRGPSDDGDEATGNGVIPARSARTRDAGHPTGWPACGSHLRGSIPLPRSAAVVRSSVGDGRGGATLLHREVATGHRSLAAPPLPLPPLLGGDVVLGVEARAQRMEPSQRPALEASEHRRAAIGIDHEAPAPGGHHQPSRDEEDVRGRKAVDVLQVLGGGLEVGAPCGTTHGGHALREDDDGDVAEGLGVDDEAGRWRAATASPALPPRGPAEGGDGAHGKGGGPGRKRGVVRRGARIVQGDDGHAVGLRSWDRRAVPSLLLGPPSSGRPRSGGVRVTRRAHDLGMRAPERPPTMLAAQAVGDRPRPLTQGSGIPSDRGAVPRDHLG